MADAFLYLTVCSIRNSVRTRLRRIRQPRYFAITVCLLLYVASLLFSRPAGGIITIPADYRHLMELSVLGVTTLLLGLAWVLPNSTALQFTSAEVHLLFTAPVSRRQLIGYKMGRLLLGTVATSVLFAVMMAPPRPVPAASFVGRTFLVLAVMGLYQTGVSLHRKRTEEGMRLRGSQRAVIAATAVVLTPAIGWVLATVALGATRDLLIALPIATAVLVVCGLWILHSDAAFEEAAAESAEKLHVALKQGYRMRPRLRANRSSSFALAPQGPLESAILWKNWMLIGRTPWAAIFVGVFIALSTVLGLWIAGIAFDRQFGAVLCFVLAIAIVLIAPNMVTADLRQDLAHLALIKSWPVSGAAVFRGELLAPWIVLATALTLPILLGTLLADQRLLLSASVAGRASLATAALLAGATLVLSQLVIQNGIAVTFPAWIRVVPGSGSGAIEMMGQSMVTLYGGAFATLILALVPSALAGVVWFLLGTTSTMLVIAGAVFAAVLFVECLVASELLGRILDRADLQDISTS